MKWTAPSAAPNSMVAEEMLSSIFGTNRIGRFFDDPEVPNRRRNGLSCL